MGEMPVSAGERLERIHWGAGIRSPGEVWLQGGGRVQTRAWLWALPSADARAPGVAGPLCAGLGSGHL